MRQLKFLCEREHADRGVSDQCDGNHREDDPVVHRASPIGSGPDGGDAGAPPAMSGADEWTGRSVHLAAATSDDHVEKCRRRYPLGGHGAPRPRPPHAWRHTRPGHRGRPPWLDPASRDASSSICVAGDAVVRSGTVRTSGHREGTIARRRPMVAPMGQADRHARPRQQSGDTRFKRCWRRTEARLSRRSFLRDVAIQ